MAGEPLLQAVEQRAAFLLQRAAVAVLRRQLELEPQPVLAEERHPVVFRRVALRRRADGVVPVPAEALAGAAVQAGEPASQGALGGGGCRAELEPLEREERLPASGAA